MERICYIVGYFGSGKSEFCVNLAIQKQFNVLCDLDVVNPYFRSRQVADILKKQNILTVSSEDRDAKYLDMPLLSEKIFETYKDPKLRVIYDLGGSASGAKLIQQFAEYQVQPYTLLFVVNIFRKETSDVQKIIKELEFVQKASGIKVTGLVNNSNLLEHTTIADLQQGQDILKEVSRLTKIPIYFTAISKDLKTKNTKWAGEPIILQMYLKKHTI